MFCIVAFTFFVYTRYFNFFIEQVYSLIVVYKSFKKWFIHIYINLFFKWKCIMLSGKWQMLFHKWTFGVWSIEINIGCRVYSKIFFEFRHEENMYALFLYSYNIFSYICRMVLRLFEKNRIIIYTNTER